MDRSKISKEWLYDEYLKRSAKNPKFSMRAFGELLEIPSGRLSQLFSQQRNITPKLAEKISEKLGYDPEERHQFIELVERERAARSRLKKLNEIKGEKKTDYHQLSMDQFKVISDPVHYDILNLIETDDFKFDVKWMALRLNRSTVEIRAALDCLERVELIIRNGYGLKRAKSSVATTTDIKFPALKRAHKKVLNSSIVSLDEIETDLRDITSMTMSIDMNKLSEAKDMIQGFRRSLSCFLESGKKEEVYRLNIQLVPVTRIQNRK